MRSIAEEGLVPVVATDGGGGEDNDDSDDDDRWIKTTDRMISTPHQESATITAIIAANNAGNSHRGFFLPGGNLRRRMTRRLHIISCGQVLAVENLKHPCLGRRGSS
jgi:hypothetical protein